MIKQNYIYEDGCWDDDIDASLDSKNTLVICFGSSNFEDISNGFYDVKENFKESIIMGCSTSGEIFDDELYENSLSIVVMKFEKTELKLATIPFEDVSHSFETGIKVSNQLIDDSIKGIFVLSDGLNINGSQLTKGINSNIDKKIPVTGGLAGDNDKFEKTWVLVDDKVVSNYVTAVGFYGDNVKIAHASQGGWKKFGIDRMVTDSISNVLYKLDNQPALEVYKTYLGENADKLPSSGLLYPLMIKEEGYEEAKVRTILAIDEENQSITFAGDIPNGSEVMFMKATFSELVDGASKAATDISLYDYKGQNAVNVAISCVGRRLVLGQKTEDEIEAVFDTLGDNISQIGYYSYGEISPLTNGECDLHNQTMTLTLIWED